jgi:hypothetical protein
MFLSQAGVNIHLPWYINLPGLRTIQITLQLIELRPQSRSAIGGAGRPLRYTW